jgi:hypothetical protein
MKTFTQYLKEGVEEHEKLQDHTKNPYHDTLTKHGFQHVETKHEVNPFARNNPRADSTVHRYQHPDHGKSHVIVTQEHDATVGHGGQASKGHGFTHRHEQSNGIMAPNTGDSKVQLHRSLSQHYGVPKGMEAPKLTASEKRYSTMPHMKNMVPNYKMNESLIRESVESFHNGSPELRKYLENHEAKSKWSTSSQAQEHVKQTWGGRGGHVIKVGDGERKVYLVMVPKDKSKAHEHSPFHAHLTKAGYQHQGSHEGYMGNLEHEYAHPSGKKIKTSFLAGSGFHWTASAPTFQGVTHGYNEKTLKAHLSKKEENS